MCVLCAMMRGGNLESLCSSGDLKYLQYFLLTMFCPNCGTGEQAPDTYGRSCGELLTDFSDKFSLINKILGINSPEKQVSVNLTINLVTSIVSALLLILLIGYFDGRYQSTHESAPPIIYLIYPFLGLVSAWQFLSFIIGIRLKSKLSGRKRVEAPMNASEQENALSPETAQKSLPRADFENIASTSVTEDTTRILDKLPRQ